MTNWEPVYRNIALARAFELATAELWHAGAISGEMHLGTGEEVLTAAIAAELRPDDAVAADHRASPIFVNRGVDLEALVAEMLGLESGLCGGQGGHMHFFAPEPLTVGSGIVGAAGPTAAGFALSARYLRPGSVAVAFFGDGAVNQGMLMESFNLAVAWELPVVFVCKDNQWAITTESRDVTGGELETRFEGFGLAVWNVDGRDLAACVHAASHAVANARRNAPSVILATVPRLDGHFLGYKAARIADDLVSSEAVDQVKASVKALGGTGGSLLSRAGGLLSQTKTLLKTRGERTGGRTDPVVKARAFVRDQGVDVDSIDEWAADRVEAAVAAAKGRAQ